MADMIIRQASVRDVDDIYEIERLCFPDPWSKDAMIYELESNPRAFYICLLYTSPSPRDRG